MRLADNCDFEDESKMKHPISTLPRLRAEAIPLPSKLPPIRLRHGQALWLLAELGYRGTVSRSTFYEYIKSLRKLGIPFGREKFRTDRRQLADYSYRHLMELAVILSLRVYHAVPDSVLRGIIQYRGRLDRLYRRAYAHRDTRSGQPVLIKAYGHKPIVFRGLFLDLNIIFSGGRLVRFGPPELLPAIRALQRFSQSTMLARPLLPMNLSLLSEQIVSLALRAPEIRSGPRARAARKTNTRHIPHRNR